MGRAVIFCQGLVGPGPSSPDRAALDVDRASEIRRQRNMCLQLWDPRDEGVAKGGVCRTPRVFWPLDIKYRSSLVITPPPTDWGGGCHLRVKHMPRYPPNPLAFTPSRETGCCSALEPDCRRHRPSLK